MDQTVTQPQAGITSGFKDGHQENIGTHLESLAVKIKCLHEVYDRLHARLCPVLGPEVDDVAGELARARPEGSVIAGHLLGAHDDLSMLERRLVGLIARIEL